MTDPYAPARCYRHPERAASVRCQRCDRPICPTDMREAAVGFQCPECVTTGRRAVRQPRTAVGGSLVARPGLITQGLIAVCVVLFLASSANRAVLVEGGMSTYGLHVADQWYRVVTANLLHFGIGHLAFNMISLWLFGTYVESALGRWRYGAALAVMGLGASAAVYWWSGIATLTAGASGIVFGLFGIAVVFMLRARENITSMVILLAINGVYSLTAGVSWQGHLGGFVVGLALGALFAFTPWRSRRPGVTTLRPHRDRWHALGLVAVAALLVALVLLRDWNLAQIYG